MNNMRYFVVIIVVVATVVGVDTPIVWEYLQLEGTKTTANSVSKDMRVWFFISLHFRPVPMPVIKGK
jgi:hypothetical protein